MSIKIVKVYWDLRQKLVIATTLYNSANAFCGLIELIAVWCNKNTEIHWKSIASLSKLVCCQLDRPIDCSSAVCPQEAIVMCSHQKSLTRAAGQAAGKTRTQANIYTHIRLGEHFEAVQFYCCNLTGRSLAACLFPSECWRPVASQLVPSTDAFTYPKRWPQLATS